MESFGRLDFAHNNAGIEAQGLLTETEEAEFDRVIAVNVKGVWLGMKSQLRHTLRQGSGAIVNTSSLAGLVGSPGLGPYAASKHGVVGLTKTAAVECAEQEIRVNAVCPAAIRTPMMDGLEPERQQELMAPQAIKRFGETSEVAEARRRRVADVHTDRLARDLGRA
ncbi:MAG: SDR family oxidoreductase [Thermomicrobiales bacterium]